MRMKEIDTPFSRTGHILGSYRFPLVIVALMGVHSCGNLTLIKV